jgi:hypothetical protein
MPCLLPAAFFPPLLASTPTPSTAIISAFLKIGMLSTRLTSRVAWVATYLTARTTSCGRS